MNEVVVEALSLPDRRLGYFEIDLGDFYEQVVELGLSKQINRDMTILGCSYDGRRQTLRYLAWSPLFDDVPTNADIPHYQMWFKRVGTGPVYERNLKREA